MGAGQAACGIAQLIAYAMSRSANISIQEAYERIYMMDVDGLLVEGRPEGSLDGFKSKFVKKNIQPSRDLTEVIGQCKPTILIGATGVAKIFKPSALQKMAELNERPVIFALSNPTSKAECTAEEAYTNTDGRCLFSSGSPFAPVLYNGRTYYPGQGNNAYIFPGVALGTIISASRTIEEEVFLIAAEVSSSFPCNFGIYVKYKFFFKESLKASEWFWFGLGQIVPAIEGYTWSVGEDCHRDLPMELQAGSRHNASRA